MLKVPRHEAHAVKARRNDRAVRGGGGADGVSRGSFSEWMLQEAGERELVGNPNADGRSSIESSWRVAICSPPSPSHRTSVIAAALVCHEDGSSPQGPVPPGCWIRSIRSVVAAGIETSQLLPKPKSVESVVL